MNRINMGLIYMVTNTLNHRIYIGQTIHLLCQRKAKHYYDANRKKVKTHFHNALYRYDKSVFEWDILEEIDNDDLNQAEIFWIAYFKYIGADLYNHSIGGESNKGYKFTEDQRKKLSDAHMGKTAWNKGRKHTEESKQRMSKSLKGRLISEETRHKMSAARTGKPGKPHNDETKRKISESKRGKVSWNKGGTLSQETKQKISLALKGKTSPRKGVTVSEETRKKQSESAKRRRRLKAD